MLEAAAMQVASVLKVLKAALMSIYNVVFSIAAH